MLERVDNWKSLEGDLRRQQDNGCPAATGERITVDHFIDRFPNYETNATTICEPPLIDFIAKASARVNYWLSIRYDVFFKNYG